MGGAPSKHLLATQAQDNLGGGVLGRQGALGRLTHTHLRAPKSRLCSAGLFSRGATGQGRSDLRAMVSSRPTDQPGQIQPRVTMFLFFLVLFLFYFVSGPHLVVIRGDSLLCAQECSFLVGCRDAWDGTWVCHMKDK